MPRVKVLTNPKIAVDGLTLQKLEATSIFFYATYYEIHYKQGIILRSNYGGGVNAALIALEDDAFAKMDIAGTALPPEASFMST